MIPVAAWLMEIPAYDLQDFPVPVNLPPEDSAGRSSLRASALAREQRRGFGPMEPRLDRCRQIIKHRTPLLAAGRDHRPDPLAPPVPHLAPRPLRHQPIEHHESDRLFRNIVRRLHSRLGEEPEITLS